MGILYLEKKIEDFENRLKSSATLYSTEKLLKY